MLKLFIESKDGEIKASSLGEQELYLVHQQPYAAGDRIRLDCPAPGAWLWLRLDEAIQESLVYVRDGQCSFPIPFGQERLVYPPQAFSDCRHCLSLRLAAPEQLLARRNLALNPLAVHEASGLYPFASANVETRGEAVFAAKNAIDGWKANSFHGEWPYTSWGINRDPKAAWRLDFGRPVLLDEAVVYLRADFPHDAWWERATLHFSDGGSIELELEKSALAQRFPFPQRRVEWVLLDSLQKAEDPSPFPALTQLELWGRDELPGQKP